MMNQHQVSACLEAMFRTQHICFRQVKNGPSYGFGAGLRLLDFVAIKKTWSPPTLCGVEIKSSRSDFLRDGKWPDYFDICHKFYWACETGLIQKKEIDDRCGLIYCNADKGTARVVRPAIFRPITLDPMLLFYLILWRNEERTPAKREEVLQDIKADREVGANYGRFVSKKLAEADRRLMENLEATKSARRIMEWCEKNDVRDYDLERLLNTCRDLPKIVHLRDALRAAINTLKPIADALDVQVKENAEGEECG